MDRAIIHTQRNHAPADAIFHDQIDGKVFDEEVRRVLQALLIERVKHGVAGAICCGARALHRRAFPHVLHVAAKRALIDRAVLVTAERHAGMFELVDRLRGLAAQIFDRVLVAEPVGALDGVEHVPGPVVGRVVHQAGGNAALRRNRVAAGWEHLGDAGCFQPGLGAAHRGAQARAAGSDNDGVIRVIDNLICGLSGCSSHVRRLPRRGEEHTEGRRRPPRKQRN